MRREEDRTAVRGIEPLLKTSLSEEFKILSDLTKPKLRDGALLLTLEGKGQVPFMIRFGQDLRIPEAQHCRLF
jgi:hypothetical protein